MTLGLVALALAAPGCRKPFTASHASRGHDPMAAPQAAEAEARPAVSFQGLQLLPPGWSKVHAFEGPSHMVAYLRWQGEGEPLMVNALAARSPEEAARWVQRAFAGAGAAPGTLGRRGVAGLQTDAGERAFGVALGPVAVMVKGQQGTGILPSAYMVGLLQGNEGLPVTPAFEPSDDEGETGADTMASLLEELRGRHQTLPPVPERRPLPELPELEEAPGLAETPVIEMRPGIAEPDLLDTPGLGDQRWEPLADEPTPVLPARPALPPIAMAPSEHHSLNGDRPADPLDVPPFREPAYPVDTPALEAARARLPTRQRIEEAVRAAARLAARGAPPELTQVASAAAPTRGLVSRAPLAVAGDGGSPFGDEGGAPEPTLLPSARALPPPVSVAPPAVSASTVRDVALASALEQRLSGGAPIWSEAPVDQLIEDGRQLLALAQVHAAYDRFAVAAHRGSPAAQQHVDALRRLFPDAFPRPPLLPPPPATQFRADDGEPPAAPAPVLTARAAEVEPDESPFTSPVEEAPPPPSPDESDLEAVEAADAAAGRVAEAAPVTAGAVLLSLARRSLGQGDYRSALDRYGEAESRGLHEGTLGRREVARLLERKALELTGRMWAGETGASQELQQLHLRFPEVFPEDEPTVMAVAAPAAAAPLASQRRRGFYVEALGLIGFLALVGVVSTRPVGPDEDPLDTMPA